MGASTLFIIAALMLGLGMTLTVQDFGRVRHYRLTVAAAVVCQIAVLPVVCFAIVTTLDLPPVAAVGMMILSAAPGGPIAGVFSHLFGGDVAFNLTLIAVNAVLSVFTLTIITNLSLAHFLPAEDGIGLQSGEIVKVFIAVLVPLAIGMIIKARAPALARRAERPFVIIVGIALVVIIVGTVAANFSALTESITTVVPALALFGLTSLSLGYAAARLTRARREAAIAASMEIGFHNAAMAAAIALTVSDDPAMVMPAGIYVFLIKIIALGFGFLVSRGPAHRADTKPPAPAMD